MKSKDTGGEDDGGGNQELSPILTCIQTIQGSELLWGNENLNIFQRISLKELKREQNSEQEDGFCFAVSLRDGSILYNSTSIRKHLGYSKQSPCQHIGQCNWLLSLWSMFKSQDMLTGQCILNFLHQKDHIIFANHLMQSLNAYLNQETNVDSSLAPDVFFCRLRTFGQKHNEKSFTPFKVILDIKEVILDEFCREDENVTRTLCVKASATPLQSAYQVSEEIPIQSFFSTRHTASCYFSHVDDSAIPYLGHLPQDMVGHSVFDFYHTDDMPQLKDIYELVVKEQGVSFRSKPYRFRVFNGSHVLLETEWSCFINPWSRKLEFIVGQHRVLRGPAEVDVFKPCKTEENTVPDVITKECQAIEAEIRALLSRPVKPNLTRKSKHFLCKRKRPCAPSFSDEDQKSKDDFVEKHCSDDASHTDSDCVVMGDISPYQDLNDSSTFSETPPACQKLRFQENIERFFASQPKTFSDGSEEYRSDEKLSNSDEFRGNSSKQPDSLPSTSTSGTTYNKQQESSSNSSKCNFSSFTTGDSGYGRSSQEKNSPPAKPDSYQMCIALTEESLSQHNSLHHKHMKHRKSKNAAHASGSYRESRNLKHPESGHGGNSCNPHKHKKWSHAHGKVATSTIPTQTDDSMKEMASRNQPLFHMNYCTEAYGMPAVTAAHPVSTTTVLSPFGMPSYHSCIPSSCTPERATAPFYMPVMYMGSIPCYPTVPSLMQTGAIPPWPCAPVPPHSLRHATPVVFPSSVIPVPCPVPVVPTTLPSSGNGLGVQSSGATATTTVLTTTTTVAPCTSTRPQNSCKGQKSQGMVSENWSALKCKKHCHSILKDSSLESSSISLTPSSFLTSEKSENIDFDGKLIAKCPPPLLQDPPWLIDVNLTPEVVYRYTLKTANIKDVLMKDLEVLGAMQQPDLVNKQLQMLQQEFKDKDLGTAETSHDSVMLGLMTHAAEKEKEELLDPEDYLFQLTAEDI